MIFVHVLELFKKLAWPPKESRFQNSIMLIVKEIEHPKNQQSSGARDVTIVYA